MLHYVGPDGQPVDERAALHANGALRDGFSLRTSVVFRDSVTDARARRDEARRAMIADLTGGQSLNDEARTRAGQVYMDSLPAAPPPSSAVLARNEAYAGMVRSLDERSHR